MSGVNGIYRSGKVVLDQRVDWPDGIPVEVHRKVEGQHQANDEQVDQCFDGSTSEDTPEGVHRWIEWFDSLEPIFTGPELERFEAELCAGRNEQSALFPHWQQ